MAVQRVVDAWQPFPFLVVVLSVMAVLGGWPRRARPGGRGPLDSSA